MPASMAATASLVSGRVMSTPETSPAKTGVSCWIVSVMRGVSRGLFSGNRNRHGGNAGALYRGASHVAHLAQIVEPARAVHCGAVVPHNQVMCAPGMRVDEPRLRRVLQQIADEGACLGHRPTDDAADMRRQIQ